MGTVFKDKTLAQNLYSFHYPTCLLPACHSYWLFERIFVDVDYFFYHIPCNPKTVLNYLSLSSLPIAWTCNPQKEGTIKRLTQTCRDTFCAEFAFGQWGLSGRAEIRQGARDIVWTLSHPCLRPVHSPVTSRWSITIYSRCCSNQL